MPQRKEANKMALNLSGMLGDVSNLASSISMQDIIQSVAIGGLGTVLISGAKTDEGQNVLDPFHLFHHVATPTTPAVTGVVSGGNVVKMSAFMALTPDQQKMFQAMGYTVIPG
jgi:hypothetical protein